MDALETIGQRRSVLRFNPISLPGDILRRVVEAAAEAPHGGSPKGRHFLKDLLHWERFGGSSPD